MGSISQLIAELDTEINEIANQTVYQDLELLNGEVDDSADPGDPVTFGPLTLNFQVGEREEDVVEVSIEAVNVTTLFEGGAVDVNTDLGNAGALVLEKPDPDESGETVSWESVDFR